MSLESIEGTYAEGYSHGREYYTNDISNQIYRVKIAIDVVNGYCSDWNSEDVKSELQDALRILNVVLEKSKKPY